MKKNMVIIVSIFTTVAYGMEENSLSMLLHKTVITLHRGSLLDADDKVNLIVVGRNQQQRLHNPVFSWPTKKIDCSNQIIYEKHKDDDSAYDDYIYKPCALDKEQKLSKKPYVKNMKTKVLMVTETIIGRNCDAFCFQTGSKSGKKEPVVIPSIYWKDENMRQASLDLVLCYENALAKGLTIIGETEKKSIAVPTLGIETGFPWRVAIIIAVKAITDFVENNPDAYDRIELFMKKKSVNIIIMMRYL